MGGFFDNDWQVRGVAVLHCRYALIDPRGRTGFLFARNDSVQAVNSKPSCFAEAAVGLGSDQHEIAEPWRTWVPYGRLSLTSETDFSPVGAGIEIGTIVSDPWYKSNLLEAPHNVIYAELKFRLLSGNIRL